jgi:transmembrane sensor
MSSWVAVADHAESPALLVLRRNALDRAQREARRRWSPGWRIVAAACLVLLIGLGVFIAASVWRADQPITYATELGERRVVTLTDGSRVSLDSASEVRVLYTAAARDIELVSGQARFDVAHDVSRRFMVRAGDQTVIATGTAFNVDMIGGRVSVTLIEGSVVVLDADAPRRALAAPGHDGGIRLRVGQQLVATPREPPTVQVASLERATAWESGQLIFEDESLAAIAGRMSRYAAHPITVEPAAANHRISGVFRAGDVATFVDTVTRYLPVRATTNPDGSVVLKGAS